MTGWRQDTDDGTPGKGAWKWAGPGTQQGYSGRQRIYSGNVGEFHISTAGLDPTPNLRHTSHRTIDNKFTLVCPPVTGCAQMTEQELAGRVGPNTPYHEQGNFCRYKDLAFSPSGHRVGVDWYWA